jgi:hypothetical protein
VLSVKPVINPRALAVGAPSAAAASATQSAAASTRDRRRTAF